MNCSAYSDSGDILEKFANIELIFSAPPKIVDTTFENVPKQRHNREENKQIEKGVTPEHFKCWPPKRYQGARRATPINKAPINGETAATPPQLKVPRQRI